MAGNIIIKPTMFLVYDYDKEEEYINSMSMKGWQLIKGGLVHHTYMRSDLCYRYKLDFNNKVNINAEELSRYLSIFEEQGWELINSTINGWHYFRKKYDPSLPEEDYAIYTDDTSLMDMLNRWVKIARFLQAFYLILLLCNLVLYIVENKQIAIIETAVVGLGIVLLEFCIRNMKNKRTSTKPDSSKRNIGGYLLISGFLLSVILMIYLTSYDPYIYEMNGTSNINQQTSDYSDTLKVKKDGQYIVDLKCKMERGALSISILNNSKVIYERTGSDFKAYGFKLYLEKGNYTIKTTYHLNDYKNKFHADQKQLEKYHLTGDLNKKSNVKLFIGVKHSLFNF